MKKRILQRITSVQGFTMIELLVVIAIIGVLAVAVLSAINPIEQINKGRDTRARSDAAEVLSASERFFTTQEVHPWNIDSDDGTTYTATVTDPEEAFEVEVVDDWAWLQNLADVSEVKQQFADRLTTDNSMVLYKEGGDASAPVHVCFLPSSNQFRLEAARKCCTAGTCPADDPMGGMQEEVTLTGGTVICGSIDGSLDDNYICLP